MNISTKFEPGDDVWLMVNNKAVSAPIERITLYIERSGGFGQNIIEQVTLNTANIEEKKKNTFPAKDLHKSKKDLLESL